MPKFTVGQVEPKRKETMYEKFKKQLKKEAISVAQNPVGATSDILNRGVVAQTLGAPVDIMNMGLRGIQGITGLPVASQQPFMGSDYINKQFENMGITSGTQRPILETAAGMLAPAIPRMMAPSQARQSPKDDIETDHIEMMFDFDKNTKGKRDLPIAQPYETIVPKPLKKGKLTPYQEAEYTKKLDYLIRKQLEETNPNYIVEKYGYLPPHLNYSIDNPYSPHNIELQKLYKEYFKDLK